MPLTIDHVMIDNVRAAADTVSLLTANGRRRIAYLGSARGDLTGSTGQRLIGYQEQLLADGITPVPDLVISVDGGSVEASRTALIGAIDRGIDIDAVLCRDDRSAVGALQALAARGRSVPGDVAVVGWDDTYLATCSFPTLTSVGPDKTALARTALQLLKERIEGYAGVGRHRIGSHSICAREYAVCGG